MLMIGLTGGIGAGKSTVGTMFQQRGLPVLDADAIGRALTEDGTALAGRVARRFPGCARGSVSLDRDRLARHIFDDATARAWLEDLLHPAILEAVTERARAYPAPRPPCCLLEGAVLVESRTAFPLAGLVVVTAPLVLRRRRLAERDHLDEEQIERRLAAQAPEHEKILGATHLIDNGGLPDATRRRVERVHAILMQEHGGTP